MAEATYKLKFSTAADLAGLNAMSKGVESLGQKTGAMIEAEHRATANLAAFKKEYLKQEETASKKRLQQEVQNLRTLGDEHRKIDKSGRDAGRGLLVFSQGLEDAQYGVSGVLNNIPQLVQVLGLGSGVAGIASIAAVALYQLTKNLDLFGEASAQPVGPMTPSKLTPEQVEIDRMKAWTTALKENTEEYKRRTEEADRFYAARMKEIELDERLDKIKKAKQPYESREGDLGAIDKAASIASRKRTNEQEKNSRAAERAGEEAAKAEAAAAAQDKFIAGLKRRAQLEDDTLKREANLTRIRAEYDENMGRAVAENGVGSAPTAAMVKMDEEFKRAVAFENAARDKNIAERAGIAPMNVPGLGDAKTEEEQQKLIDKAFENEKQQQETLRKAAKDAADAAEKARREATDKKSVAAREEELAKMEEEQQKEQVNKKWNQRDAEDQVGVDERAADTDASVPAPDDYIGNPVKDLQRDIGTVEGKTGDPQIRAALDRLQSGLNNGADAQEKQQIISIIERLIETRNSGNLKLADSMIKAMQSMAAEKSAMSAKIAALEASIEGFKNR